MEGGGALSCEERRRQDRDMESKKYIWGSGVRATSQVQPPKVVFWLVTRDLTSLMFRVPLDFYKWDK